MVASAPAPLPATSPVGGDETAAEAFPASAAAHRPPTVLLANLLLEEPVDRRLAEHLVEPCMQLTRNAIAHGIEGPDEREASGKPREATITFSARRVGNRLVVTIADDGAGVDVSAVRTRAVEAGLVTETLAAAADDQTLLELLFFPGFSMRENSPDLLAGRVAMSFLNTSTTLPYIRNGQLRALAVAEKTVSPRRPGSPPSTRRASPDSRRRRGSRSARARARRARSSSA